MTKVEKFLVEIEWLDNKFQAEVECDIYDTDSVVVTAITLTDIYQPFNKINKYGNPWVTVSPAFTFAAEYLPDSVMESVEEQVYSNIQNREYDWDADDSYKDSTYDR